jgi:hypothetical protein
LAYSTRFPVKPGHRSVRVNLVISRCKIASFIHISIDEGLLFILSCLLSYLFVFIFTESPIELEQRPQNTPLTQFLEINKASPTSLKPFSWTINVDDINTEGADEALDRIGTLHPDFVDREYEGK